MPTASPSINPEEKGGVEQERETISSEKASQAIKDFPRLFLHFTIQNDTEDNDPAVADISDEYAVHKRFWTKLQKQIAGKQEAPPSTKTTSSPTANRVQPVERSREADAEKMFLTNFPYFLKKSFVNRFHLKYSTAYFTIDAIQYGSLDVFLTMVNGISGLRSNGITLEMVNSFLELFAPVALVRSLGYADGASEVLHADVEWLNGAAVVPDPPPAQPVPVPVASAAQPIAAIPVQRPAAATVPETAPAAPSAKKPLLDSFDKSLLLARASWIIPILLAFFIWNSYREEQNQVRVLYMNKYDSTFRWQYQLMQLQNEIIKNIGTRGEAKKDTTR